MLRAEDILNFLLELSANMADDSPEIGQLILALTFTKVAKGDAPDFWWEARRHLRDVVGHRAVSPAVCC